MKTKLTAIIFAAILIVTSVFPIITASAVDVPAADKPSFAIETGGIYAHAKAQSTSSQAWTIWGSYTGINADQSARYIFLPKTADDDKVELYNNFDEEVTVNGTAIPAKSSAIIGYTVGEGLAVERGSKSYTLIIRKSDAEASVYVNDTNTSFTDYQGNTVNADLYSFLIQNKENSVKGSDISVVSDSGIVDTTLKKIKGRGNTNWRETDKKPFNLTFNNAIQIGHTSGKKFSFVSNAKDSTLLRNSVMYDLAHDVGSPYSPNSSFVDFYVNGVYRGCYIACDKVDLGKSSLVSLKDTSDTADSDFNFLVEVDVWNYQNDVYFVTDKGYHIVLKAPDLDGYDENDPSQKAKYDFIKNTYQNFENVLYSGTLSELEEICDLDSLATMYLLQDFGKNCDGGYTSTYFTYNAAEKKFYAAPLWDCDSDLGAVNCTRDGCSTSTSSVSGWTTRLAIYNKSVNPYGKAFTNKGKTADGKTFEEIVRTVWSERFVPAIDVLFGRSQSNGRLKSIDEYASSIANARYNNYVMWDFMWYCSKYTNTGLKKTYDKNYDGELLYLKDWTQARAEWITAQFSIEPEDPEAPVTVYFKDVHGWNDVHYYVWGDGSEASWPGNAAEYIGKDADGCKLFKAEFDRKYTKVIFNNNDQKEQTENLNSTSGVLYAPTNDYTTKSGKKYYTTDAMTYGDNPLLGDLNFDKKVNINDATLIQLALVELKNLSEKEQKVADTDRNGIMTIRDATMIQLLAANKITEL